ncbi:hypothetical protein CkaCkLH20_06148 [Colletotrichum karsti]|uniref:Uncharacterized protein n=1 Tax=Colletotrichum karsti TaxID=1095194 RepID=A0A9P6ICN7_9PEZI|nr:uncharacterized protein CkaCkLH20_06148 [Colletotrichum karsti]KAF9876205.1 hypothetical protein CkaCkLH20_06148 [Colletotrichum karsti]
MPPQTRSGGVRPVAAPPDRVYKSSRPPKQVKFPHRKTEVRTYSARKPTARVTSHKQKTLTQMYESTRSSPIRIALSDDEEEEEPARKKKRRKTTGDEPTPSSSFHTQTLTQMSRRSAEKSPEEEDDIWQFQPSDEEPEKPVLPSANDKENLVPGKKPPSRTPSVVPQTPTNKRTVFEIPSSQGSPLTPMLARYSPAPKRSPLKDKSTNTNTPIKLTGSVKRPRTLTIQDSYATVGSQSPTQRSSPLRAPLQPAKNVRFITPHPSASLVPVDEEETEDEENEENEENAREVSPSPKRRPRSPLREIADSDDDSDALDILDEEAEGYDAVGEETQFQMDQLLTSSEQAGTKEPSPGEEGDSDKENVTPATSEEEEEEATVILSKPFVLPKLSRGLSDSERRETVEVITSSPEPTRHSDSSVPQEETTEESISETPTQSQRTPRPKGKGKDVEETPKTPHTQGLESQRISLDVIRAMAPQTDRSDIFISIHPDHMQNIVDGTKNHEFRAYKIPNTVSRMWLYITKPVAQLQYMACISEAKVPGEVEGDGIGNAEFNQLKTPGAKFAYRLYEVYELNDPSPLPEMIENGWLHGPPQKYNYVPPAVVGHLMANLRCSIFGEDEEDELQGENQEEFESEPEVARKQASQTSITRTVSQELADQIRSDIEHSTLLSSEADILVPSSQTPTRNQKRAFGTELFPKPALPPTPFSRPPNPTPRRAVRPSQATTVSQSSSPSLSPARSVPRPANNDSSMPIFVDEEDDSPIRLPPGTFNLDSSQLLSKSQMLPESLLREDEGEDIIYDSEQDDEL